MAVKNAARRQVIHRTSRLAAHLEVRGLLRPGAHDVEAACRAALNGLYKSSGRKWTGRGRSRLMFDRDRRTTVHAWPEKRSGALFGMRSF
jgi:hypothetical protein